MAEQFLLALAGFNQPRHSKVEIVTRSGEQSAYSNHHNAARCGVVYLPRDRRATGIFPVLSVLDNFGMPSMPRFSWGHSQPPQTEGRAAALYRISVDPLSGNGRADHGPEWRQSAKVLLARLLALKPRVMLLNDPTRGVDLNTRMKFYEAFRKLAREEGIALVILSSEIEEILQICDSVSVFRDFECSKPSANPKCRCRASLQPCSGRMRWSYDLNRQQKRLAAHLLRQSGNTARRNPVHHSACHQYCA
ncbi:sugar ABC transporter ATP-binding protein [Ochrobactrum pseudogrignonense]|nr:sugar ABC transporter ATP-binding protein [Brucella pseudogrignonensis]